MDTIDVVGLRKNYGRTRALDGLDLRVAAGEVHGFLGPNGAGKSTTIRVLLGLARADGGTARVFGADPWADAAAIHARLAYVPGDVSLWPNLSGGEAIDVLSRLRAGGRRGGAASVGSSPVSRSPRDVAAERARLLDVFALDPRTKVRAYSKGNRQKVALVAAFATPAELYVFDEPTSGLDPLMEQVFRDEVRRVAGEGATVLLSSHILGEVEQLCSRVSIVRRGRTVETGALDELRHLTRTTFTVQAPPGDAGATAGLLGRLGGVVHDAASEGGRIRFTADATEVPRVLALLADAGVSGVTAAPPTLEELFLRHYEADGSGGAGAPGAADLPASAGRRTDAAAHDPRSHSRHATGRS